MRWDSGVGIGTVIGTDFDPMLAKVIAHAPTRAEAAGRLALALARTHLGGVVTNRDFLVATLRTPEFLAGDTTTDFIERVGPARTLEPDADQLTRAATMVVVSIALEEDSASTDAANAFRSALIGLLEARLNEVLQSLTLADLLPLISGTDAAITRSKASAASSST